MPSVAMTNYASGCRQASVKIIGHDIHARNKSNEFPSNLHFAKAGRQYSEQRFCFSKRYIQLISRIFKLAHTNLITHSLILHFVPSLNEFLFSPDFSHFSKFRDRSCTVKYLLNLNPPLCRSLGASIFATTGARRP